MPPGRPTVLVIHGDGDVLDLLTRRFEASGCEVVTAVSGFRAQTHLEGERWIDVVVAPWDLEQAVGGEVYRWALQKRYDLRDQFVFIAAEVPPEFDRIVGGRCLAVAPDDPAELVRVALAAVARRTALEAARDAAVAEADRDRPTLLLADDEPVLLAVMAELLAGAGYAVTRVDTGLGAIAELERADFDALVIDWRINGGSGAEVYRWVGEYKPWLAARTVFLAGEEGDDPSEVAPGRPMFRKGQDSTGLTALLREIVREARAGAA